MKSISGTIYLPTNEIWTRNPSNRRLSMLRNCKHCNKEFYADVANVIKDMGHYCCFKCMRYGNGNEPKVKCICKHCGNEFEEFVSRLNEKRGIYCSKNCYSKSMMKENVQLTCMYCGKVYEGKPWKKERIESGIYDKNYCSLKCLWAASKTGKIINCANPACNKEFYVQHNQINRKYCSPKCMSDVLCGKNHHLYKEDKIGREGKEFTHKQRYMILARYNHQCPVTGFYKDEVKLHIHHINPIHKGGDNDIFNGVPVWVEVHKKIHNEDFDIKPYLLVL